MRMLVIEDNPGMAATIKRGLTEQGYNVDTAANGHDGHDMAATGAYELIILDCMLPDMFGTEVCANLRRVGVSTPILMLTALGETKQKIEGLESGADVYLTKPFEFDELIAHIRALLRRSQPTEAATLSFHDIVIDLNKRQVTRQDDRIALSNKEFMLLEVLMRNAGRVLTRTLLLERIWNYNFEPNTSVLETHMSRLRAKIDKPFDVALIQTVRNAGYSIHGPR